MDADDAKKLDKCVRGLGDKLRVLAEERAIMSTTVKVLSLLQQNPKAVVFLQCAPNQYSIKDVNIDDEYIGAISSRCDPFLNDYLVVAIAVTIGRQSFDGDGQQLSSVLDDLGFPAENFSHTIHLNPFHLPTPQMLNGWAIFRTTHNDRMLYRM